MNKCGVCGKTGGVLLEAVYQREGQEQETLRHCPTCNPLQNVMKGNVHIVSMKFGSGYKR